MSSNDKLKRLNWGCGRYPAAGWINSDTKDHPGVDLVCDIRSGLPLQSDSVDYAVGIHVLPELPYPDLVPALSELRRVLKPGGALRLGLPDMDKAIQAYLNKDSDYFLVKDEDAKSVGAKFVVQMIWFGYSRTLFTHDFIEEQLEKAGFAQITRCAYRQTSTPFSEIVELDNREQESLFVEAVK